jgi:hypothetical protein
MWKKIAIAGTTMAVILGAGTAALAASGDFGGTSGSGANHAALAATSSSAPGSNGSAGANKGAGAKHRPGLGPFRKAVIGRLQNFEHGSWVTKNGSSTVEHSAIHGDATKVSATSITVVSADKTTMTFTVSSSTKVHTRAQHTGAAITSVKSGDTVFVTGTGSSTLTAQQVVDVS